jgi:hypothetical protein
MVCGNDEDGHGLYGDALLFQMQPDVLLRKKSKSPPNYEVWGTKSI